MAETSLAAYRSFSVREMQDKEREVYEFMKTISYAMTREQIAVAMGWKESQVCGRVNSLVGFKDLEEFSGGKTKSGRPAKLVRIPLSPILKNQSELFNEH